MKIDILAIGAHPDDVEIGIGGIIYKHVKTGYKVGIIDLTKGELGTNGTPAIRNLECKDAAEILNVSIRYNLGFPDGWVNDDKESILAMVEVLRLHQPKIVLAPFYQDFHPDHEGAGKIVKKAHFYGGLKNIITASERYRPFKAYFYQLSSENYQPSFIVDISDYHDVKLKALKAHKSQVEPTRDAIETRINNSYFIDNLIARDRYYGNLIGVRFGEPLYSLQKLGVKNIMELG